MRSTSRSTRRRTKRRPRGSTRRRSPAIGSRIGAQSITSASEPLTRGGRFRGGCGRRGWKSIGANLLRQRRWVHGHHGCGPHIDSWGQKPIHRAEGGSHTRKTLAWKGGDVEIVENHGHTRERWTAMTMCTTDQLRASAVPPAELLFKSGPIVLGRLQEELEEARADNLSAARKVTVQVSRSASYATADVLEFMRKISGASSGRAGMADCFSGRVRTPPGQGIDRRLLGERLCRPRASGAWDHRFSSRKRHPLAWAVQQAVPVPRIRDNCSQAGGGPRKHGEHGARRLHPMLLLGVGQSGTAQARQRVWSAQHVAGKSRWQAKPFGRGDSSGAVGRVASWKWTSYRGSARSKWTRSTIAGTCRGRRRRLLSS